MKVKLNQNAQKLTAIASSNDSRPVLQNIHIEDGKAMAADGYIMAETKVEIAPEPPGNPMNVPVTLVNLLKGIAKILPDGIKDIIVEEKESKIIGTVENSGVLTYSNKANTDIYPKLDQLWPHTPYKGIISLNAKLLRRICSLCTESSDEKNIITFRIRETMTPVEFVTGDFHGLIMPMFSSESQNVEPSPLWSKLEVTK